MRPRSVSRNAAASASPRTRPIAARPSCCSAGGWPSDKLAHDVAPDRPGDGAAVLGPLEQGLGEMQPPLEVQARRQWRLVRVDHRLDHAGAGRAQRLPQLLGAKRRLLDPDAPYAAGPGDAGKVDRLQFDSEMGVAELGQLLPLD